MAVTVASIITKAKQLSDMENSNFVSASEWLAYVNDGYKELYDLLVSKFEDYYTVSSLFTVAAGATSYSLPAAFYKLRGLDRSAGGGDWYALNQFNFQNRNRSSAAPRFQGVTPAVEYRILGSSLIFSPDNLAPGDYRLWYVPLATTLTSTADTVDGVNGWENYIEVCAAMSALVKEESDVSALVLQRQNLGRRIEEMAANRDVGAPQQVTDVTPVGSNDFIGWGY